MSSADMNHPCNSGVWPDDPYGDMTPILEDSVAAAKQRHPSASGDTPGVVLTLADRCDGCGVAAHYRVARALNGVERTLEFCGHHMRKHMPRMAPDGWRVTGSNPDLVGTDG